MEYVHKFDSYIKNKEIKSLFSPKIKMKIR